MACVRCRWPPEIFWTSQEKLLLRKPKVSAMELSGWSMSGSTPAPADNAIPVARYAALTCISGASAANASAPLSA